jgi:hypothetical protein
MLCLVRYRYPDLAFLIAAAAATAVAGVLQSSSGAASTLERLTKETDTNITQVHADVTAKKNLVSCSVPSLCAAGLCCIHDRM